MRKAKVADYWRNVDKTKRYTSRISKVCFHGVDGFDDIDADFNTGITVVCGRNGTGKTTFLKTIHKALSSDSDFCSDLFNRINISNVSVEVSSNDRSTKSYKYPNSSPIENVEYFDPAELSLIIQQKITSDSHVEDWTEGVDPSQILNENIELVRKVTGKKYDSIGAFEVTGFLPDDKVIPYFIVEVGSAKYSNESMGQGEHKLLLILWNILSAEDAIMLIEEPEAFICPRSILELMDIMAFVSSESRVHFLISSHSEHVLSKISNRSETLFVNIASKGFTTVKPKHRYKCTEALGLSAIKKGSILVEDDFAARVTRRILSAHDSKLLYSHHIDIKNGESNIEKILMHNIGKSGFDVIGIFDADFKGKIEEENYIWPILFLPGKRNLAPEKLVIEEIRAHIQDYAQAIKSDFELVDQALSEEIDHHDFFIEISKIIKRDVSQLKESAIELWMANNKELIQEFVFMLENHGERMTGVVENDDKDTLINVNDCQLLAVHDVNRLMDFTKMKEMSVKGKVGFSKGTPVFLIE